MSQNPNLISISIDEAIGFQESPHNLYIKLADGRFLLILRKGTKPDVDRLKKYQLRGMATLFASEREIKDAVTNEAAQFAVAPRLEAIGRLSNVVFDELRRMGLSEESYNHAKAVGKAVRTVLEKEPKLSEAFLKFQEMHPNEVRHSLMVSALSTVLASGMDWIKPTTLENLGLGAVLHDVGKLYLPKEIADADPGMLSAADRKILEGHCESGRAMLSQLKTVSEDVCMIVAHHHERSDGSGYPLGLKDHYIHPLARVVALANEIVDRFEREQERGQTNVSIKALVEATLNSSASKFNRDVVKAIQKMLASESL